MLHCRLLRIVLLLSSLPLAAISQSGVVVGLGDNQFGQLGTPIPTNIQTATQIAEGVKSIKAAGYLSLILKTDGSVWGSGQNNQDQILDTSNGDWRYPEPVLAWTGIEEISASSQFTLVRNSGGQLLGRGYNFSGQLGYDAPQKVSGQSLIASNVSQTSAGANFTIWLTPAGDLYGIGSNFSGTLGTGTSGTGAEQTAPVLIASGVTKAHADNATLFLKVDGTLWGTGGNHRGLLGLGHTNPVNTPTKIADNVVDMISSNSQSFYITASGELWGMGDNEKGELGPNAEAQQLTPVKIVEGVTQVAASARFIIYIDTNGNAWGLGENESGQLGVGDSIDRTTPVMITENVVQVSTGYGHSLFLKTDGTVWGAGNTYAGPLFSDPSTFTATPQRSVSRISQVSAGGDSTFVLRENRTLWAAGQNNYEVLGTGEITREGLRQVATDVTKVSSSGEHTVYIKTDGSLWFTGRGWNGESGLVPQPLSTSLGTQIASGVIDAAAGDRSTLFVDQDHKLWVTGFNQHGQLGVGHKGQLFVPQMIKEGVSSVSSGPQHSLFVHQDGGLWGMGLNGSGNLGTGTGSESHTPVFITPNVAAAACGAGNTYFLTKSGDLMGLGSNSGGQLGDNPANAYNATPQLIARDVTAFATGDFHVVWINTEGELWGTGRARSGQLGAPIVNQVTSPRLIARQVTAVAAGEDHTLYTQVPETYLTNLSTRVKIPDTGEGRLVAGFVIGGTEPLTALIRAVGPGLAGFGVEDTMPNPSLQIFNSAGTLIQTNDDWAAGTAGQTTEISTVAAELGAFGLAADSQDSALIAELPPGAYTAQIVRGDAPGGAVLLEVYNRNPRSWKSRLLNLSVRTDAGSGADTLTAGFVIEGERDQSLLVRAVGPSLATFGVTGFLPDPQLAVLKGSTEVATNDDWSGDAEVSARSTELGAFQLAETTSPDAASIVELAPDAYTIQVRTKGDETGNTLVEIYAIDN